jgi:hypothetical protein
MITSDLGRRVFCLQIAGLNHRYHSINPPSISSLDSEISAGISYTDTEAILKVGAFQSNIDPSGGIASYSPLSIELAIKRNGDASDPGIVFSRVGKRSAAIKANLEEDITFDSLPLTISIDKDLSSLAVPCLMHVGAETFRVSFFSSSAMTITNRSVGGSIFQSHEISLQGTSTPIASTEITIFRGRRAKLFIAYQDSSGNVSDYTEIINGFIESSPYLESTNTVSLNILPIVSLIDGPLADAKKGISYLLQNFHYFENKSNVLEFGSAFRNDYTMILDSAEEYPTPGFPSSQSKIYIQHPSYNLDDIFDETRNNGRGFINCHPRYPLVIIGGIYKAYPTILGVASNTPYFIIDHNVIGSIPQSVLFSLFTSSSTRQVLAAIPNRGEIKRVVLGQNEVKRFPGAINESLDSSGPSTHTGITGAFSTIRINGDNLISIPLSDQRGYPAHEGKIHLWYSSRWYRESLNYNYQFWSNQDTASSAPLSDERRVFYPLDYWNDGTKPNYASNSLKIKSIDFSNLRSQSVITEINISKAYHQANEKTILVESPLGLPSSLAANIFYGIQVETYDYEAQRRKVLYYRATHETPVLFEGSTVGYLIHIPALLDNVNNGHFGDWRGEDRTQVTRGVLAHYISPGEIILQVLQSGGGGNNGAYDKLGVGLSIHENDIDVNSFLENGTVNSLGINTAFSVDDFDCREFIDSLLKSLACIITMKRSLGRSKITLQALGAETENNLSATLTNDELLTSPVPHYTIYEDIVTQIKIQYGWDNDENEFKDKVTFNNQDAINRYGGEKSAISIDLYGLSGVDIGSGAGDAYNYLLPIASRVFNTMSNPAIEWKFSIGTGKSIYLDVGSYIKISSPHLKSYGDSYGVVNEIGMIRSINQNLMSEGADLEVAHTGISVVNWNSTLKVTFITSTNSLTVSINTYSNDDLSFFKAGDVVDFLPFGDEDNSINSLEIQSIVGSLISFTSTHGISTLGTIEPTSYTLSSEDHKIDAYLSNNNILGASDEAKEYS